MILLAPPPPALRLLWFRVCGRNLAAEGELPIDANRSPHDGGEYRAKLSEFPASSLPRAAFRIGCAFAATILLTSAATAQVGKVWPSERKTWIDSEFGHEITQWTNHEKRSWHLYFNIESFIDAQHAIIESERTGRTELFRLSLETGELTQLTEGTAPIRHVWHWPNVRTVWFTRGASRKEFELFALDTGRLECRSVARLQGSITSMTATCDGRWVLVSRDKAEIETSRGPFAVYRIDAQSGAMAQISPNYGFIVNHLQASPTDPAIMIHAWQHIYGTPTGPGTVGNAPFRTWWLRVDGTDGGPVAPQEFGIHRTHDFWFGDGSRIGYAARYFFGPNRGRAFLGSCLPDGSDNYMMELAVGPSHPMVYGGGRYWIADQFDGEKLLTRTETKDRRIVRTDKLFRHASTMKGQPSHPHPRVSPDESVVLFSTDRTGTPQVYTVRLDGK